LSVRRDMGSFGESQGPAVLRAVVFDLGNTLVSYFTHAQWPGVLAEALDEVADCLRDRDLLRVAPEQREQRVREQRRPSGSLRVRPLLERLRRIFGLSEADLSDGLDDLLCRRFMTPIFACARLHDDALPVLEALRRRGLRTGILSNTPWGSPASLWREELARHGLRDAVDAEAFCEDVGWRKPDARAFRFILRRLRVEPGESLFIGDDPEWDIAGPRAIGMKATLIDRIGDQAHEGENPIRDLWEFLERLWPQGASE
jgi:putative hydrolase of the HAD superfamily